MSFFPTNYLGLLSQCAKYTNCWTSLGLGRLVAMVYYFTSNVVSPSAFLYVGKDKFESMPPIGSLGNAPNNFAR
jgi:hypothetical protein